MTALQRGSSIEIQSTIHNINTPTLTACNEWLRHSSWDTFLHVGLFLHFLFPISPGRRVGRHSRSFLHVPAW